MQATSARLVTSRLTSGKHSHSVFLLRLIVSHLFDSRLPSSVYRVDHSSTSSTCFVHHHAVSLRPSHLSAVHKPPALQRPSSEDARDNDCEGPQGRRLVPRNPGGQDSRLGLPCGRRSRLEQVTARGSRPRALRGHARKVAGADLASITAQYHRESADDSLVAGLLASLAASDSEADDEGEGGDDGQSEDGGGAERGEESEDESSNERMRAEGQRDGGATDDDEPGSGGDDESAQASMRPPATARSGRGRSLKAAKLEATALRTGASKSVKRTDSTATTSSETDTAARLRHTTERVTRIAYCVNCGKEHDVTAKLPGYCSCCGAPW